MDLINNNLLEDNFSNASGCGLPPVCNIKKVVKGSRKSCKTVLGKKVCVNIPTVKTVVNKSCVDSKARYKACMADPNRKKLLDKVKDTVKDSGKTIKKTTKKATTGIKKTTKKLGTNIKRKVVKLKDKVGASGKAFRNKFRSVMRKGILFNIKNNIHGTASKLYPAVSTDSEVANKKYKKSFVGKSRGMYNDVVKQWKSLGGNENDLRNAIRSGHSKKFLKAPYKSANGDDSMALYLHYAPSNLSYWENPNTDFYWGATGNEEDFGYSDENVYGNEQPTQEGVLNEATGEEEVISQEEEVHGIRAFFAWLKGLFGKNQATENPYAEGTAEYHEYEHEKNGDAGNEPDPSEANDPDIQNLLGKGQADGAGTEDDENAGDETDDTDDDTILGINKTAFWIGVGVITLVGGYFGYKKFIAKK